jgi:hypothetical protein
MDFTKVMADTHPNVDSNLTSPFFKYLKFESDSFNKINFCQAMYLHSNSGKDKLDQENMLKMISG